MIGGIVVMISRPAPGWYFACEPTYRRWDVRVLCHVTYRIASHRIAAHIEQRGTYI